MSIAQDMADFRNWWLDELEAMLPRTILRRRPISWTICASREIVRVGSSTAGVTREATLPTLSDAMEELVGEKRHKRPSIEIVLEPGTYLERQLAPFPLPKRRAREMAVLDLHSSTPLDPAGMLVLFAKYDKSRSDRRYFIVKKAVLEPVVAAVENASGQITSLKARAGNSIIEIELDGLQPLSARIGRGSFGGTLVKAGILASIVGIAATFAHAQWRYADSSRKLDTLTQELEPDVKVVRSLSEQRNLAVEQIESVRQQKRQSIPLVRIWEELTRVISDDTWLSDLSIDGDKITFTGISTSAAGLIADLEASPLFRSPTFSGPVSRAPGADGERFTIEMRLEL